MLKEKFQEHEGHENNPPSEKGDNGGFDRVFPGETLDVIDDIRIIQKKRGHRCTTDSILLARLSSPKRHARVLELGTGCGIVSILLAKKAPSLHITAVEIQKEMAELAERNVLLNDMSDSIEVLNADIKKLPQIFPPSHFDGMVTNPPYRRISSGHTSPSSDRAVANQEFAVTIKDIMNVSRRLLKTKGRLSIIYTAGRLADLFAEMRACRIEPKTLRCIYTKEDSEARLVWVEGVKEGRPGVKIFSSGVP